CTSDQRTIDALGKVLFGRNAEAVGNDVHVGGRIAHFNAGNSFLRRMPVTHIIDLGESFSALVRPHAIKEGMARVFRPSIDGHRDAEFGADRSMILPRHNPGWMAATGTPC